MNEELKIRWFVEGIVAYYALPNARLPICDEGLYPHCVCCGWHSGMKLVYDHLTVIGGQLLPPSEVPSQTGQVPDVLSVAWLKEFLERYRDYTRIELSAPSAPPRLGQRREELPLWIVEAYKTWQLLDQTQAPWCDHDRFLRWTCCAWHTGLLLMQEHIRFEANKLLPPASLPMVEGDFLRPFRQEWWDIFTDEFNLPPYQV